MEEIGAIFHKAGDKYIPKVFVFDLDGTLWDHIVHVLNLPFSLESKNTLRDAQGKKIILFDFVTYIKFESCDRTHKKNTTKLKTSVGKNLHLFFGVV